MGMPPAGGFFVALTPQAAIKKEASPGDPNKFTIAKPFGIVNWFFRDIAGFLQCA